MWCGFYAGFLGVVNNYSQEVWHFTGIFCNKLFSAYLALVCYVASYPRS